MGVHEAGHLQRAGVQSQVHLEMKIEHLCGTWNSTAAIASTRLTTSNGLTVSSRAVTLLSEVGFDCRSSVGVAWSLAFFSVVQDRH